MAEAAREYPARPIASAHAVIVRTGRVLLVRRAHPPSQGRWSLPGGVVRLGETLRDAARREVLEECGVEIEVGPMLDVVDVILPDAQGRVRFHYVVTYLLADLQQGEPRASSDAAELRWAGRRELASPDMHPRVREVAGLALAISPAELVR